MMRNRLNGTGRLFLVVNFFPITMASFQFFFNTHVLNAGHVPYVEFSTQPVTYLRWGSLSVFDPPPGQKKKSHQINVPAA